MSGRVLKRDGWRDCIDLGGESADLGGTITINWIIDPEFVALDLRLFAAVIIGTVFNPSGNKLRFPSIRVKAFPSFQDLGLESSLETDLGSLA